MVYGQPLWYNRSMDIKIKRCERVKFLYNKKWSGPDIAKKLVINQRYVYRILDRLGVKRRTVFEQNKINFLKSPLSFKFKDKLSIKEKELLIAVAMLYYGEGAKTGKTVDLANSDPVMLKIFLKFLRKICRIDENKLRFYLYCFSNQNPDELIGFWCNFLKIKKENLDRPYIKDFNHKNKRTMPYGVLHIRYSDLRLLNKILLLNSKLVE